MRTSLLLGIVFFGSLWGLSEAALGGALYGSHVPYASVPLTVIGFGILTIARVYFPHKGSSTLIAALAMLYKFANTPFFVCHLVAILLLGLAYDLTFSLLASRNKSLCAAAATYLGYAMFALTITYVFRDPYWTAGGWGKILRHVGLAGTMAAAASAILVPLSFRLGQRLNAALASPFKLRYRLAVSSVFLVTAGLWVLKFSVSF